MSYMFKPAIPARERLDGWTPDRQRAFLDHLADGQTVEGACRMVQLSPQSAYALRKRACGMPFALGWRAASLHAREKLAAVAYSRALDGYSETVTRPDGSIWVRHKFDNRLLLATLARLDRLAEEDGGGAFGATARHIAGRFEEYVELIEHGDHAVIAGFLAEPLREPVPPEAVPLAELRAAEDFLRDGDLMAAEEDDDWQDGDEYEDDEPGEDEEEPGAPAIDTSDLVVADRQGWTHEQWQRAAAAGLVTLQGPPPEVTKPKQPQLKPGVDARGRRIRPEDMPEPVPHRYYVWAFRDDPQQIVYTALPPRRDFTGYQHGQWGDEDYWRVCSVEEAAATRAQAAEELDALRLEAARERDDGLGMDEEEEEEEEDEEEGPPDI